MLRWLKRIFFGRSLEEALSETKKIRVNGTRFEIKKIDVLDHLDGSKVMTQYFALYKAGVLDKKDDVNSKKVREHVSQVLVAGVVSPVLSHKDNGEGLHVEKLFNDWELAQAVYFEIMLFTNGKKKV
jgi:hypothetical protein